MRHNKVIYLISVTITEDEYGNQIEEETERKVYANEYSIGSSEFYNAAVTGLRPEIAFEIYSFEYNKEQKFKYNDKEYNIIRTQGKGERIVLIGEKVAGNA